MLKDSILRNLETLIERHEEVGMLMTQPEIIGDQNQFRDLSVEYSQLEPVVTSFKSYQTSIEDLASAKEMMKDSDPDMREMGVEEMKSSEQQIETLSLTLQKLLLPKDPHDNSNIFLEIRAGTGGDEAAIFAGNL
ncbi:MAG: PCRF domain-containing protein, partial [Gammaproteobacteria bacterium]|nr:PCRF domain-containing protein [Gammaproteobacteria bacterium]